MVPGLDLIVACPHCQALAKVFTVEEPDPTGAITWSDGWQDAPLMPRPARITRCPSCAKLFWSWDAPQLGYAPPAGMEQPEKAEWSSAPYLEPLDETGAAQALAEGFGASPDLEMELRVLLWWRGNDPFRRPDASVGYPTAPGAIANMEALISAMREGEEDLLLFRAEAQRQLGRFDDALETLRGVCCSDWWPAKSRLLSFIEQGSRKLEILFGAETEREHPAE